MSGLKVLIVGASIAGPTAAYWFARAGAHVTVIERFPKLRENGQNVDLRTAGVTVMRRMEGMEVAVRAKKLDIGGISIIRPDGRPYGTIKATGNPDQQSLVSEYEIFRGDLAKILVDMTKDHENVKYVFGEQVASIQQHTQNSEHDGPITVEFQNGYPAEDYDLVVACDGATSRTRALGLGCDVRDHMIPTNCWAAYFSIKQDLLEGNKLAKAYTATGGRFMGIGPNPRSTVGNCVGLMGIHTSDNTSVMDPFRAAMKHGDGAIKKVIAAQFEDAGWKTSEIMKDMMDASDFYVKEIVQIQTPTLYKGRFVLVGDAGYGPTFTGTGTTLALAGAYVLAGEVGKHKGDLAAGLEGYEKRMRPIINDMQKVPFGIPAVMAPQTAWGLWLRNHIFAFIAWTRILEFAMRLGGGGAVANSNQYSLPNYEWRSP